MLMIVLEPIGYVRNAFAESRDPESLRKAISEIEILPDYAAGLQDIEQSRYIVVVFEFNR